MEELVVFRAALEARAVDDQKIGRLALRDPEIGFGSVGGAGREQGRETQAVGAGRLVDQPAKDTSTLPALFLALAEIEKREDLVKGGTHENRNFRRHPPAEPQDCDEQEDERQLASAHLREA